MLTSDALFPHFFPAHVLARLEEVGEWEHYDGREDSAELREHLSRSDALMTTWHSPFLRMEMFGNPRRVRLIAHCGGELKARMEPEGVVRTEYRPMHAREDQRVAYDKAPPYGGAHAPTWADCVNKPRTGCVAAGPVSEVRQRV